MVFHIYQDVVGQWRWYLSAPNGIKLAAAPVGYVRRNDCLAAIKRVREANISPLLYDNFGPIASVHGAMVA
jgi:uncharacterized protein YegP (UPF0339 family)